MKDRWIKANIGNICSLEYGKPLDSADRIENGLYPAYGANGVYTRTNKYYYDKPSIIIGRKGTAGAITLTEEKFYPLDVTYYVVFDKNKYDLKFLYYLFLTKDIPSLAKGVKPGINRNDVYSLSINYPSALSEQQRIVKILDTAFAKIDTVKQNAQRNLQNSKELFQSILKIELTPKKKWKNIRLKDVGLTQTGQTPPTNNKENFGNYIPFIKPADIDIDGQGTINYNNEGLSEIGVEKSRFITKGSTVMVCIGATIGKVGYTIENITCNQQINSITPNKIFFPKFVYYSLTTSQFFNSVINNSAQTTLPIINKSKWESLDIYYPIEISEQQQIVSKLDALSAKSKELEKNYLQTINDCNELKKAILAKAFNGEL